MRLLFWRGCLVLIVFVIVIHLVMILLHGPAGLLEPILALMCAPEILTGGHCILL
jgi:hypothetical protein